jgi:hypothetical protein
MLDKISVVNGCEFLIKKEALGLKLTSNDGSSTAAMFRFVRHQLIPKTIEPKNSPR